MIIWSGWGLLVPLLAFACGMAGGAAVQPLTGERGIVVGVGLGWLVAAGLVFLIARRLSARERVLVDPRTGQTVRLRRRDSLFFVPMRYWTWVLAVLGVLALALGIAGLVAGGAGVRA